MILLRKVSFRKEGEKRMNSTNKWLRKNLLSFKSSFENQRSTFWRLWLASHTEAETRSLFHHPPLLWVLGKSLFRHFLKEGVPWSSCCRFFEFPPFQAKKEFIALLQKDEKYSILFENDPGTTPHKRGAGAISKKHPTLNRFSFA